MSDPLEQHPHFSVVRRLAVGGMGEVLLTRFTGNAQVSPGLVVVKRTIVDHPSRGHQDEMLREEGRVALRLRHANLVDTYAVDELDDHPLLVMEFLAGRSMAQVLGAAKRKSQPVPVPVALAVLYGSACGLHFAHTLREGDTPLGLVHRDVSPANIFATFDGKVKVIDFGVAKADDSEIKTSTGILKGKLGYMSPEHAKGEKLDPRSDLWSLGVVFWEMLVADRLFGGQNPAMTLYQITQGEVEGPAKRRPDIPPEVDALCLRLLTKDREQRISSGADLVRAIEQLPPALWRNADVGGFLAERFPAEADAGRREAAEVARPTNARHMPVGLVDGGASSDEVSGALRTLVRDEPYGAGGRNTEELPVYDDGDKTMAVNLSDVPALDLLEEEEQLEAEIPTRQIAPVPRPSRSPAPTMGTPLQHLTAPPSTGVTTPAFPRPAPQPASRPLPQRQSGPMAAAPLGALPPEPSGPSAPFRPQHASGPVAAAPGFAPASPPPPAPAIPVASPPPPQAIAAPPPAARPPVAARARTDDLPRPRPGARRSKAPSAVAVALSTFGGLAALMGIVLALLAGGRDTPIFVGYMGADGTDAVVARAEDVPARAGPPFQVRLDAAQLALEVGRAREAVPRPTLERELRRAGVWDRAQLPRSSRQRIAAALPLAITILGLLCLAFALPGLLIPQSGLQLKARGGLVALLLVSGGAMLQAGGLGWPGLAALKEPPEVPRLVLGEPSASLQQAELTAEQRRELSAAVVKARAALLRGQAAAALEALAPAAAMKADLAEIYGLLGDAQRDLGKHSLAEGHYLRYLLLEPEAPDREEVQAYLKQLQSGG